MWYYEINGKQCGPVSTEEIEKQLLEGILSRNNLVWCEGMPNWKRLNETELNGLAHNVQHSEESTSVAPPLPGYYSQNSYGYLRPRFRINPDGLKRLFIWWIGTFSIASIFSIIYPFLDNNNFQTALKCLMIMTSITAGILGYILLYRFWQVNQDGRASTTPGRAVGFMFIPFFNLYWCFRAYPGLSLDQNRYIDTHFKDLPEGPVHKSKPAISFIYAIFSFLGGWIANLIIISTFILMVARNVGQAELSSFSSKITPYTAIFTFIALCLSIWMRFDLYKTAMNICDAEGKNLPI